MTLLRATVIALSLLASTVAHADTVIKGGEWRTVMLGMTPEPNTVEQCMAENTMERAAAAMASMPNCTKRDIKISGNVATLDVACGAMSMQGTATFDSDSAYRTDLMMRVGPDGRVMHVQSTARWIGACRPGETPVSPGGRRTPR
jgi:hypothetical protein